jgi:hypothetical protein
MYGRVCRWTTSYFQLRSLSGLFILFQRVVFLGSFAPFTLCHLGGALGRNLATILSTRLLAGIFGSSPLTNAGGAISDMWDPSERALPQALYASAPFLGPILGPIVAVGSLRLVFGCNWCLSSLNIGIHRAKPPFGMALHVLGHVHVFRSHAHSWCYQYARNGN